MSKTETVTENVKVINEGDSKLQKATEISDSTNQATQDKVKVSPTSSESVVDVSSKITRGDDSYLDQSGQGTQLFEGTAKNSAIEYQNRVITGAISKK